MSIIKLETKSYKLRNKLYLNVHVIEGKSEDDPDQLKIEVSEVEEKLRYPLFIYIDYDSKEIQTFSPEGRFAVDS